MKKSYTILVSLAFVIGLLIGFLAGTALYRQAPKADEASECQALFRSIQDLRFEVSDIQSQIQDYEEALEEKILPQETLDNIKKQLEKLKSDLAVRQKTIDELVQEYKDKCLKRPASPSPMTSMKPTPTPTPTASAKPTATPTMTAKPTPSATSSASGTPGTNPR